MNNGRRSFVAAGVLLGSGAILIRSVSATDQHEPTAAEVGYLQDVSAHHLQALDVCRCVLGRGTGGSVQAAATEVLENQAMEVGQMRGWLTDWGSSTVPPTNVMAWMTANQGTGMPLAMMPGYASDEQLSELSALTGLSLGKRWLELLRAHVGGVMMASEAHIIASSIKVVRLKKFQIHAKTFEIALYDRLLSNAYSNV